MSAAPVRVVARARGVFYAPRPVRPSLLTAIRIALLAALAVGCAPQIGDGCGNSSNCSINGDRICDTAQPGGYCTIFECQPDRCPDSALCVRFNPTPARRAVTACMRRCAGDSDCRSEYECRSVAELEAQGLAVRVTDASRGDRFCVARGSTGAMLIESALEVVPAPGGDAGPR